MSETPIYQNRDYLRHDQYKDSGNLNARAELHRRFSTIPTGCHITLTDLSPGMVAEAEEALTAYALSTGTADQAQADLSPETQQKIIRYLEQMIAHKEAIHITKSTGLFVARPSL